ncbi:BatD family protein, partial [Lysobacter sp.]|uniref:BatD family protein n=1 Tax=Lysobacter sp. TaxID=72226 RepID=UPI002D656CC7
MNARPSHARSLAAFALFLLLALLSLDASAQIRAWVDRDRIAAGETVTLNIETTSTTTAEPDYAPLMSDFFLSGHTSRREFVMENGRSTIRTLFAVALRPRRDGIITVPALQVGSLRTQPIPLTVAPAAARRPAHAGDDVFIESQADDDAPYVQQSVGWVVRLYSVAPLISGQLDQPAPDGASLQRVGDDAQYQRNIGGRRYNVVERRFLLVPERSGELVIPPAHFEGRGAGGFFDDLFGDRGGALEAQAAPATLQVQAVPANAPQPWLPLQNLQLRYQSTPQDLRAGAAATLTLEAVADGATAAQMPELQLPTIEGVQVFAEPVQADERFVDGRPRVKLTRRFSLVPSREGQVQLAGVQMNWWDVRSGNPRTTRLPPLSWTVAPGSAASSTVLPAPSAANSPGGINASGTQPANVTDLGGANRAWVLAALLFAALWLFTLVWGLHRGEGVKAAVKPDPALPDAEPARSHVDLKRLLDRADLGEVADGLCSIVRPPARDLDEVRERLDDPQQRQ